MVALKTSDGKSVQIGKKYEGDYLHEWEIKKGNRMVGLYGTLN